MTLTPMLCARFLRQQHAASRPNFLFWLSESLFGAVEWIYRVTLQAAVRFHWLTTIVATLLLVGTVWIAQAIPKGFLPNEDLGQLLVTTEASQDVSFDRMMRLQREGADIVKAHPAVAGFSSSIGTNGRNITSNTGRYFIRLMPREERRQTADQVAADLRAQLAQVAGLRCFVQVPPPIRVGGRPTKSLYQLTLQASDTQQLYSSAGKLEARLKQVPELRDVTTDLQLQSLRVTVDIDRAKASTLGISASQIEEVLANAYSSRQISTIYAPTNSYQVILELDPAFQRDPEQLARLYVRSSSGLRIPLDTMVKIRRGVGPLSVNHSGQMPSVTLSFDLQPGVSLGTALDTVNTIAREVLPDGVTSRFQGTAEAFQDSVRGLGLLLLSAVLVIYIVLGMLYESYIHPLTILSGLPSAGFGALATLYLCQLDLDVYGFVGLILLVGIVKKNAIMMIDFALEAQRNRGSAPQEAIIEACLVRFRPIMMTTMAALMGILPIALGYGAGAESRRPLGLAVLGGLVVSQFLTLYITPVFYMYLDRLTGRRSASQRSAPAQSVRASDSARHSEAEVSPLTPTF